MLKRVGYYTMEIALPLIWLNSTNLQILVWGSGTGIVAFFGKLRVSYYYALTLCRYPEHQTPSHRYLTEL